VVLKAKAKPTRWVKTTKVIVTEKEPRPKRTFKHSLIMGLIQGTFCFFFLQWVYPNSTLSEVLPQFLVLAFMLSAISPLGEAVRCIK